MFLGVDPGLHGALAVLNQKGQLVHLLDTPIMNVGTKKEYDRQELKRILRRVIEPTCGCDIPGGGIPSGAHILDCPWLEESFIACVELIHAMPGQGVVSMWRMGQGFEFWMMALTMLEVAVETVTPQRWKSVMLDGLPKGKDASRHRAKALWPQWAERFSRKKDDGRAEACLIAEYIRRQWVKT